MLARLTLLWDRVRNSLWALPMAVVALIGASAILALQLRLRPQGDPVWWLYSGDATAASNLLANLLTATITMATLAISITMVVLTLAAQSLGPRLIPIFMSDARTKLTLGLFIGTVAYLLIVLRMVADSDSVPQLAVTLGTTLVLASVIILLFFVHHLARAIVADTVIARVGATLDQQAESLLPVADADAAGDRAAEDTVGGAHTFARRGGYIQFVDYGAIVRATTKFDAVVILVFRSGQFVVPGETVARVKPRSAAGDLDDTILAALTLGDERTAVQDIEYSIRQLVEIAVRALSPGINDPNTACSVIDRLALSIATIMARGALPAVHRDNDGTVRLIAPTTDFDGILDTAFHQIRQAGASAPAVLICLADRLGQLLAQARPDQSGTLLRHLNLVQATGRRAIPDLADRTVLDERIGAARTPDPHHRDQVR